MESIVRTRGTESKVRAIAEHPLERWRMGFSVVGGVSVVSAVVWLALALHLVGTVPPAVAWRGVLTSIGAASANYFFAALLAAAIEALGYLKRSAD